MYISIATVAIATATSTTVTSAAGMQNGVAGAIQMPAAMNSTALSFQVSYDNVTYTALYGTAGSAVSYTVAANRVIPLDPAVFGAFPYLKLVCGTAEADGTTFTIYIRAGT